MSIERKSDSRGGHWRYRSKRVLSQRSADLRVKYRASGKLLPRSKPGSVEYFLTERYALFTSAKDHVIRCDIHHSPWALEEAEAEFEVLSLADPAGIKLPPSAPLLHFSKAQDVLAWAPATVNESSSGAARLDV